MPTKESGLTPEQKKAAAQARMAKARMAIKTPRSEINQRSWETRRKQEMAAAVGLTPEQFKAGGEELVEMTTKAVINHASKTFRSAAGKAAKILIEIMENVEARPEVRLAAANSVLDRSMGKAIQTNVNVNGEGGGVITLDRNAILTAARRIAAESATDTESRP